MTTALKIKKELVEAVSTSIKGVIEAERKKACNDEC